MAPLLHLRDVALTFGGQPLLEAAEIAVSAGRARLPRRAQRLGQVDAAEDRGRAGRARQRRALRPAGRDHPLSAAGAGFHRLQDLARLCRGRARAGRRCLSRAVSDQRTRPDRRGGPGDDVGRRVAARRAGAGAGAGARHPAARRADQPSRPAGDRMAGAGAEVAALGHGADQP